MLWKYINPTTICLAVGILLIIAGLVLRIREILRCKTEVEAECVSVNYHYQRRSNGTGKVKISYPVWRYYWDGKTYFKEDQNGNNVINYRVGEKCTLCIDPNNPELFYRKGMSNAVVTLVVGCLWTGIVVLIMSMNGIMDFMMQFLK